MDMIYGERLSRTDVGTNWQHSHPGHSKKIEASSGYDNGEDRAGTRIDPAKRIPANTMPPFPLLLLEPLLLVCLPLAH